MLSISHQDVRTTLTLDEDVARRLQEKARRSGASFKAVVNETLRLGLNRGVPQKHVSFVWRESALKIGIPFESTSQLLERLDGPLHR